MKNNLLPTNVEVNGKSNTVRIIEIQSFFEIIKDEFDLNSVKDLSIELESIKDDIMSHYPDDKISGPLKRRLKIIQEIQYLFLGFLAPVETKASE